jgi:hypothetical protein
MEKSNIRELAKYQARAQAAPRPIPILQRLEVDSMPSQESIARRAYEYFLSRGRGHGHDRQDWLSAERDLKN